MIDKLALIENVLNYVPNTTDKEKLENIQLILDMGDKA
jgi:hypothetical protein